MASKPKASAASQLEHFDPADSPSPTTTIKAIGRAAAPLINLLQRLNAAQQEVDYVQKEKRQGMRYSIVSHDAVTAKIRPVLVKHGVLYYPVNLAFEQVGNRTQCAMTVRLCQPALSATRQASRGGFPNRRKSESMRRTVEVRHVDTGSVAW